MPLGRAFTRALSILLATCASAHAVGTLQLVTTPNATTATLNGAPLGLKAAPRLVGSRVLVPLRETLTLLQLPALSIHDWPLDVTGATTVDGEVYVDASWLATTSGISFNVTPDGQLKFTSLRTQSIDPLAPQARFLTAKSTYAPGEPVSFVDYSFDPDGVAITKRDWVGRQEAYFAPGEHTVTLTVTNAQGKTSVPFRRTIKVEGPEQANPLDFALRHAPLGSTFADSRILTYAPLSASVTTEPNYPLLFSDSPETPTRPGILYRDTVSGQARTVAYHVNGLSVPARLYVLARNVDGQPVSLRVKRQGDVAPTRIVGTLGQVALMEFFSSSAQPQLQLLPGQEVALYASPLLMPGSGANVLQDLETSGRVEVSFVLLPDGTLPSRAVVTDLPVLPHDGIHHRGTFPGAVRRVQVKLDRLPARLAIGDGKLDPVLEGIDATTGLTHRLSGNYGVLYDIEVHGAANTALALSPRGGNYRGAMQLFDGANTATLRVPGSGVLTQADAPLLLWRAQSDRVNFSFVPANGSSLPVALLFYRVPAPHVVTRP